jgi:hypothetical protein
MSSDPDACVPAPVTDFVFDLHDRTRRSLIASEQANLYSSTFKELNAKVCTSDTGVKHDSGTVLRK